MRSSSQSLDRAGLRRRVRNYGAILAVTLWTIAAVNMATPGVVARSGHLKGEDYSHFYVLGRLAHDGQIGWLYDTAAQARYLPTVIPGAPTTYFIPVYGPQVALLFQPFAALPYIPSLALWTMASVALFWGSCFAVWRRLERLRPYRTEVAILAIGSPALWQLILHGQNSAIAIASLTAGWLCLRSGRHALAGLALGLLFYKPQLALAAVVVFALTGRWAVVAAMAASTAVQLTAVHVLLGPDAIVEYVGMLRRLPDVVTLIEPKLHLMHSFRAFFSLLPLVSHYALPLSLACSLGALAVVVWHWRSRLDEDMSFALLLIVTILVSPHTSVYDLVLLAPALLIIADRALAATAFDRTIWFALACAFLLPLASHFASFLRVQPMVLCLAWLLIRCGRATANAPDTLSPWPLERPRTLAH